MAEKTFIEMFHERVKKSGPVTALKYKAGGEWRTMTWNEWNEASREVAFGLAALGVNPADRVVIYSNTRREWLLCDMAMMFSCSCTVPIYQSSTAEQAQYIINDSGAIVAFAENPAQYEKLKKVRDKVPGLKKIVLFEGAPDGDWAITMDGLRALGREYAGKNPGEIDKRITGANSETVTTIIYTSGTTGDPKGVILTHGNYVAEINGAIQYVPLIEGEEQLLFLPLAHIFAKVMFLAAVKIGAVTAFAESIEALVGNMKEIRPHFMGSVPRIYEKVYQKILTGVQEGSGLKKAIFHWAVSTGKKVSLLKQGHKDIPAFLGFKFKIADKLVFSKLKQTFGGRLKFFVSSGAPLAKEIAEFFHAADILILEGYGLTEVAGAACLNPHGHYKFGSVGKVIPGAEVKIADDGEILMKGPIVMKGYFNNPAATQELLEPDGWFHSGDIGEIDAEGFVRITDRKKDIIVTSGGKKVPPQNLENMLKANPLVSQAMVYGDKRNYLTALITLNEETARKFAADHNIAFESFTELTKKKEIIDAVQAIVDEKNKSLASYESIKKFTILERDFTQEANEITPTLKVKRKVLVEKYRQMIDAMYK